MYFVLLLPPNALMFHTFYKTFSREAKKDKIMTTSMLVEVNWVCVWCASFSVSGLCSHSTFNSSDSLYNICWFSYNLNVVASKPCMYGTYVCYRRVYLHENWTESYTCVSCFCKIHCLTVLLGSALVNAVCVSYAEVWMSVRQGFHSKGFKRETW